MELILKIIDALPKREGRKQNGEVWVAQQFVGQTLGQYPKNVAFDVFGEDKIREFNIVVGTIITAYVEVESRQSPKTGGWYTMVRCYKLGDVNAVPAQQGNYPQQGGYQQPYQQQGNYPQQGGYQPQPQRTPYNPVNDEPPF